MAANCGRLNSAGEKKKLEQSFKCSVTINKATAVLHSALSNNNSKMSHEAITDKCSGHLVSDWSVSTGV